LLEILSTHKKLGGLVRHLCGGFYHQAGVLFNCEMCSMFNPTQTASCGLAMGGSLKPALSNAEGRSLGMAPTHF